MARKGPTAAIYKFSFVSEQSIYLNLNLCILILMKNYIIWGRNLVLLLLEKSTYLVKSWLWASMNQKVSPAVPNFRYKLYLNVKK